MELTRNLQDLIKKGIQSIYEVDVPSSNIVIELTKKEFDGDYTCVTFPLAKILKQSPKAIAEKLGSHLRDSNTPVSDFQVVQGFLNLSLDDQTWLQAAEYLEGHPEFWKGTRKDETVLVEFSSPNTNKPLHLGHIRNILLGWATAQILEARGYRVIKTQIINDRGIAICKSMVAWSMFADQETPDDQGMKPDHFVGKYYVRFESAFQEEYAAWQKTEEAQRIYRDHGAEANSRAAFFKAFKNAYFNQYSALGKEARETLIAWEENDPQVRALWQKMNAWVYQGFDETYTRLGVGFDKVYYESDTYLLGKDSIESGLQKGLFYRKADQSVWVDLTDDGLDEKLLLRSDGTSVYMTQDIGTAEKRYADFKAGKMIYVVADEQNYHFNVLFRILRKLGAPYADGLHHLAYGMVDLPTGKMKSREGTVVDADELLDEVLAEATAAAKERGEIAGLPEAEQQEIISQIALAALKFFIIKVDARRRMVFNPKESVDLQGQTGPYIQNAYVRIQSILRKAEEIGPASPGIYSIQDEEKKLLAEVMEFRNVVMQAADQYNPALIANFSYALAKAFHRYYHEYRILNAPTPAARRFRIRLIKIIAHALSSAMGLLGMAMPSRM